MKENYLSPETTIPSDGELSEVEPKPIISLEKWLEIKPTIELEPNELILYHGTIDSFGAFETPTGVEEMDVTKGGVIYFYDNLESAGGYGGATYICVSKVCDPVPYAEQRRIQGLSKKKGHFTRGVYVALPSKTDIIGFIPVRDVR